MRELYSVARRLSDPLAVTWRMAASRTALFASAAPFMALLVSALVLPSIYTRSIAVFGLPLEQWPAISIRILAALHLASTVWGKLILAVFAVVTAVHSSAYAERALIYSTPSKHEATLRDVPQRYIVYSDNSAVAVLRKLRQVLALLGYRWHGSPTQMPSAIVETSSTRQYALAAASAALALLALLGLYLPRTVAGEAIASGPNSEQSLATLGAKVFRIEQATSAGRLLLRSVTGDETTAASLRYRQPTFLGATIIIWERSGPGLAIEPLSLQGESNTNQLEGGNSRLFIMMLPGEQTRYITLPQGQSTLRVSLAAGPMVPHFLVELLPAEGSSSSETYTIIRSTTLRLGGILLRFDPGNYYIISIIRVPLLVPALALLLIFALGLIASRTCQHPNLRISLSTRGPIVAIEIEAFRASPSRMWWLVLIRSVLR